MITKRNEQSKQIHAALIEALAREYEKQGYFVKADHINHPNGRPPEVNGHVPDIAAYANNSLCIVAEAETCESISDMHTHEQWEAFSKSAYLFDIIVPKACLDEAQRQAYVWGISVNKWWWLGQ